jgi:hypothetical protein
VVEFVDGGAGGFEGSSCIGEARGRGWLLEMETGHNDEWNNGAMQSERGSYAKNTAMKFKIPNIADRRNGGCIIDGVVVVVGNGEYKLCFALFYKRMAIVKS